jgi:outer membrane receptor protein involved in Fe transport
LLPKLGLTYAPDRNTSFFATVGAGFKPGGFSAFTGTRSLAAFGPERTKTFEAGVTRPSADQKLTATARLFYYDITGYQIERSFATGGTGNEYLVVNAPRARSFGGELELNWQLRPGLTLAAEVGATDVTLREFTDPFTGISYAGNRAPAVPVYDASLRADYEASGGFFGGLELTSNGRTYYTESEDLDFGQRAYALLGVHLGYAAGNYRLTVYGENLADARYYSAITPGTGHGTPGAPRTVGVEVRVKM